MTMVHHLTYMKRNGANVARLAAILIGCLAVCGSTLLAQQPAITAQTLNGLDLGTVERGNQSVIGWDSPSAAQMIVTGPPGYLMTLQLVPQQMENQTNTGRTALELDNSQCAFSYDDGQTWHTFTSGYLSQNIEFPGGTPDANGNTSVLVRVGGTFTATGSMRRGDYQGQVQLIVMCQSTPSVGIAPATTGSSTINELGAPPHLQQSQLDDQVK